MSHHRPTFPSRDPDGNAGLWCYTSDSAKRWDECLPLDPGAELLSSPAYALSWQQALGKGLGSDEKDVGIGKISLSPAPGTAFAELSPGTVFAERFSTAVRRSR